MKSDWNADDGGAAGGDGRAWTLKPGTTRVKFWGVRGSIPSPGPETVRYGGNTACVEVRVGSDIIVLDAGSGLRRLGLSLVEEFRDRPAQLSLLITHTHWDHIQGFPFFLPAYDPKNKLNVYGYDGTGQGLRRTLSSQMESPYFPIAMREMPGHVVVRELRERAFKINGVGVQAKSLNHPGGCTGYRLATPGGSVAYLPDVELSPTLRGRGSAMSGNNRELAEFIAGADMLIIDAQYDAKSYKKHAGWGHSCVEDSVALALQSGVKHLFLFHHDPDHADLQITRMTRRARDLARQAGSKMRIDAAREGAEIILSESLPSHRRNGVPARARSR